MSKKEFLLSKSIAEKTIQIDPNNKNYTSPRTYGVYEILETTDAKRFRFGNHPVREKEVTREFESVKRVAIFLEREDAKALADFLNK
jgi:hypothetical protein